MRRRRKSHKRRVPPVAFRSSVLSASVTMAFLALAAATDLALLVGSAPAGVVLKAGYAQQLVIVPCFFTWFATAYRNLRACEVTPRYRRYWAIWGFFVPFINLIRPYRMLTEIWRSAPLDSDEHSRSPVGIWWLTWLVASLMPAAGQITLVLRIVAAVLAVRMVRGVTASQERAVPFEVSGIANELERADGARARLQLSASTTEGDPYRASTEGWLRFAGAEGSLLRFGPNSWWVAGAELELELELERVERVVARRAAPWPFATFRYSVLAVEADGNERLLLDALTAPDARVALATLTQRLDLYGVSRIG